MYAFLGVTLNMGLLKKPTLESYWDTIHKSQYTPWFGNHFNRDRYSLLIKFLHFNDNADIPEEDNPEYKTYKTKPIVSHFQKNIS